MSDEGTGAVTCGAAVERLVEAGAQSPGSAVEAHVRSCMSCFRAMNDLREVPRVAAALRAAAPPLAAPEDRFWETLALQTTDAAAMAVGGGVPAALKRPADSRAAARRRHFRASKPAAVYALGALAVAAAAGWVVMVHRPAPPVGAPAPMATASLSHEEGGGEALSEVADLDSSALRRLLDRLGRHAPAALAGGTRDGTDTADIAADDEPRVSDEVAELDGDALRRVASSLHGAAL